MKTKMSLVFRVLLGVMFILAGANHFINPNFYLPMMPDYLPWHLELIYISGVIELGLGIALFISRLQHLAAWGMIALMIAVFPANLHMYLHPERFPDIPPLMLFIRLPLQGVMIWWAWLYTRRGPH